MKFSGDASSKKFKDFSCHLFDVAEGDYRACGLRLVAAHKRLPLQAVFIRVDCQILGPCKVLLGWIHAIIE